jgi:hypothetical protein
MIGHQKKRKKNLVSIEKVSTFALAFRERKARKQQMAP